MRGNGNSSGFSTVKVSKLNSELNQVGMRRP